MLNDRMNTRFNLTSVLLGLGLLIFLITVSLIHPGLPSGHDLASHVLRSKLFIVALQQGQFPVRWVEWITPGNGLPLFNFYQGGFYYLVAMLYSFTHSIEIAIKLLLGINWFLAALFTFLLTKRFGVLAALAAAIIYVFTPYFISDMFVRAAYPEFTVLCLLPGLLWSLENLIVLHQWRYGMAAILFVGLMIVTHIPSVIIFAPLIVGFCLFWLRQSKSKKFSLLAVALVGLLGVSLIAFFLLPALSELSLVQYHLLLSNDYDFHQHFVYFHQLFERNWGYGFSKPGDHDGMSFQLGLIAVGLILFGIFCVVLRRRKLTVFARQHICLCLILLCNALFFTLSCSGFFWEQFKFIQIIQYPWRFLMNVPILSAMLAACLLQQISQHSWKFYCAIAVMLLSVVAVGNYLKPAEFFPSSYFAIDSPDWTQSQGIKTMQVHDYGFFPVNSQAKLTHVNDRISVPKNTIVRYLIKRDTEIQAQITTAHATFITINERYFPGWKIYVDGNLAQENHQNPFGFMQLWLPSGTHQVMARFENTMMRTIANWISLVVLIGLLLVGLGLFLSHQKKF